MNAQSARESARLADGRFGIQERLDDDVMDLGSVPGPIEVGHGYMVHAARASEVCSHGTDGYCADDAVPGERELMDFLYSHAHAYAVSAGADNDDAEEYAAWSARQAWSPGEVTVQGSHRTEFERFKAQREAR